MAATGTIIAAIIAAGVSIGTAAYQSSQLEKGAKESKKIAGRQEAEEKGRYKTELKMAKEAAALQKANLEEQKRQFDVSAGMRQEENAYERYENQFGKLANVMSQNKQLEDLFINRLKGLRG